MPLCDHVIAPAPVGITPSGSTVMSGIGTLKSWDSARQEREWFTASDTAACRLPHTLIGYYLFDDEFGPLDFSASQIWPVIAPLSEAHGDLHNWQLLDGLVDPTLRSHRGR